MQLYPNTFGIAAESMKNITPISFSDIEFVQLTPDSSADFSDFFCEEEELNDYLRNDAKKECADMFSTTHLLYYQGDLVGYFSLVTDTIIDKRLRRSICYPYGDQLPAIKIARLARDAKYKKCGIGFIIMQKIFLLTYFITKKAGCRLLTVDAKESAIHYYEEYSFVKGHEKRRETSMFLDIKEMVDKMDADIKSRGKLIGST